MNKAVLFFLLLSLSSLLYADIDIYIDNITQTLDTVKTMHLEYVREISASGQKEIMKIRMYDDFVNLRKAVSIEDAGGLITDMVIIRDTMFIPIQKNLYFFEINDRDLFEKMFNFNVFGLLTFISAVRDNTEHKYSVDKNGIEMAKFTFPEEGTYSKLLLRFDKDGNPDLIEAYNMDKVVFQTYLKAFKQGFPYNIKTFSKMGEAVLEENIRIGNIEVNCLPEDSMFEFDRTGELVPVNDLLNMMGAGITQW